MIRIVRMTFREECVEDFLADFETNKAHIRAFPGCTYLELWKEKGSKSVYLTYSHWHSEEALDRYRHSPLFKGIWAKMKPRFSEKVTAWSVEREQVID